MYYCFMTQQILACEHHLFEVLGREKIEDDTQVEELATYSTNIFIIPIGIKKLPLR